MKNVWFIAGLLVLMVLVDVLFKRYRKKQENEITNHIMKLLANQKFDEFDEYVNQKEVKQHIPPFNLDYLKLNAAFLQNDEKKIQECFDRFEKVYLTKTQKQQVYFNGFTYYVDKGDQEKATIYKDKCLAVCNNQQQQERIETIYQIRIKHSYQQLETMLQELPSLDEEKKNEAYYLIGLMYDNKGEKHKADEYFAKIDMEKGMGNH